MSVEEESEAASSLGSTKRQMTLFPSTGLQFAGDGAGPGQDSEMLSMAPEGVLEGEVVDQRG